MLRSKFYVCPICGNVIHSMGESVIHCHGILLSSMEAETSDDMQLVKLYPEQSSEVRFKIRGVKKIYYYCNRDGLFYIDVLKGIDDREKATTIIMKEWN